MVGIPWLTPVVTTVGMTRPFAQATMKSRKQLNKQNFKWVLRGRFITSLDDPPWHVLIHPLSSGVYFLKIFTIKIKVIPFIKRPSQE